MQSLHDLAGQEGPFQRSGPWTDNEESRDQMGGDFNTKCAECPQTSSVMIWSSTVAGEDFNFYVTTHWISALGRDEDIRECGRKTRLKHGKPWEAAFWPLCVYKHCLQLYFRSIMSCFRVAWVFTLWFFHVSDACSLTLNFTGFLTWIKMFIYSREIFSCNMALSNAPAVAKCCFAPKSS